MQVWADEDREPPWDGELDLEDAETGAGMELAFDDDARAVHRGLRRLRAPDCRSWRCATEAGTRASPLRSRSRGDLRRSGSRAGHRVRRIRASVRAAIRRAGHGPRYEPRCLYFLNLSLLQFLAVFGSDLRRCRSRCTCSTARAGSWWFPRCASGSRRSTGCSGAARASSSRGPCCCNCSAWRCCCWRSPVAARHPRAAGRDHVIVLDTSAWMAARAAIAP